MLALSFAAAVAAAEPIAADAGAGDVPAHNLADDGGIADASVSVGYVFRSVDAVVDDRAHGGAALVGVDVGPWFRGFGARLEGLVLGFPARDVVAQPVAIVAGGPALTYALDDTNVKAVARVGALGGAVVDGGVVTPALGGSVGLLLRFRAGSASHVDADVVVPVFPATTGLVLQAAATLGIGISLDGFFAGVSRGESLASLLLPAP